MTTICTGWHPEGFDLYGQQFIQSFDRYWPDEIKIRCWVEDINIGPMCRAVKYSLWHCEGIENFISYNQRIMSHCGKHPVKGWRTKDHRRGYCFRYDAVRFCKQMFIPEDAAKRLPDGEVLAWFDADVVTFDHVPPDFIDRCGCELQY